MSHLPTKYTKVCLLRNFFCFHHQPTQTQTSPITANGPVPGLSLDGEDAPGQDTVVASTQEVTDQHPSMGDRPKESGTEPANPESDAGLYVETQDEGMDDNGDQPDASQPPPTPTQQQVPAEEPKLPPNATHRGKGVGEGPPLPSSNGGKGGSKRANPEDEFYTESEPPAPLTRAAIDGRLRRVFKKRKDGSYVVDQQWVDMFSDTIGNGRNEVMAMFEKVAYDRDRGGPNSVVHTCQSNGPAVR